MNLGLFRSYYKGGGGVTNSSSMLQRVSNISARVLWQGTTDQFHKEEIRPHHFPRQGAAKLTDPNVLVKVLARLARRSGLAAPPSPCVGDNLHHWIM